MPGHSRYTYFPSKRLLKFHRPQNFTVNKNREFAPVRFKGKKKRTSWNLTPHDRAYYVVDNEYHNHNNPLTTLKLDASRDECIATLTAQYSDHEKPYP